MQYFNPLLNDIMIVYKMKIKRITDEIKRRPFLFIIFILGYISLDTILNKTYSTISNVLSSYPIYFSSLFIFFNVIFIPTLVSSVLILSIDKINDLKRINKKRGLFSFVGMFGGLLGGACPSCFVGLFPAFIGLFGLSLTLNNLPFYGLEIQALSSIILITSLHYLTRDTVCKVNIE